MWRSLTNTSTVRWPLLRFRLHDRGSVAAKLHAAERAALIEIADRIGLDHPQIHFEIFYGASYNERSWWDNHRAYDLGYRPTGRAEDFYDHAMAEQAKLKPDPVGDFYQGGTFCSMEFSRDAAAIVKSKPK